MPKRKGRPRKIDNELLNDKTLTQLKEMYMELLAEKEDLENRLYCHHCGKYMPRSKFYVSTKWASGVVPTCKKCLYIIGTGYDEKTKELHENIDTVKKAFKLMDLPFYKNVYDASVAAINDETRYNRRGSVFQQMVNIVQSLPAYRGLGWADSDFEVLDEEDKSVDITKKAKTEAIKLFGEGFADEDYRFLQEQYKDWTVRYTVEDKAKEEIIKRICFKQLDIWKAQRNGRETKDLDKTFQELLGSANLKPVQNRKDPISDGLSFGQLIQKWEDEKPIPEPEEDFKDVDKIGLYLDVFFKGHLAKMLELKNPLSHMYTKFLDKYTVKKPEYDSEEHSEQLFESIFGRKENDDVI